MEYSYNIEKLRKKLMIPILLKEYIVCGKIYYKKDIYFTYMKMKIY